MSITLVTGAAGFVGSHLCEALRKEGRQVRGLVQHDSLNIARIKEIGVEVVYGDILDAAGLKSALEGVDVVFHLAAKLRPSAWIYSKTGLAEEFESVNFEGTRKLADLCGGVKTFVFVSSIAAAGVGSDIDETCDQEPATEYGQSKRKAEKYLLALHAKSGFPVKIIRPGTIYGPRNINMASIFKFLKHGVFPSFGPGMNSLPFTYIEHLIDELRLVEEKGVPGEAYFAVEDPMPFRHFARVSAEAVGKKLSAFYVPKWAVVSGLYVKEAAESLLPYRFFPMGMDIRSANAGVAMGDWICSNKKIKELGWKPRCGRDESLALTARWYNENGLV